MNRISYVLLFFCSCTISAFAQVLLKKAALKKGTSVIHQYLNFYVISAYLINFSVLLLNVWLLKFLPMSLMSAISESLLVVFSINAGMIIFKERLTSKKIIGCIVIVSGIFVILI